MTTPDTDARYERMGAAGAVEGLFVRFEPGFGLNVYVGRRQKVWVNQNTQEIRDYREIGMSIDGWETLCGFVDQWRERRAGCRQSKGGAE